MNHATAITLTDEQRTELQRRVQLKGTEAEVSPPFHRSNVMFRMASGDNS